MKLEWSARAWADRDAIFDHIVADSPQAAVAMDDRIAQRTRSLMRFPESGRPGRIEGTRELVIDRTPYIIAYRITGNTVRILRVLHGSQLWPDGMPDH